MLVTVTGRSRDLSSLCLMLLAVNFIMFYGSPDVSWTADTREVPAEPCQVEACSGGPMAAGCMLVPVHAHGRGPGAPTSCGWQLFPGSPVKGLTQRLLGKEELNPG